MDIDIFIFGHESNLFYLCSQFFAITAAVFSLFSVQQCKKTKILDYTVAAGLFSVLHYLFLSAWSGVLSKAVSSVRSAIADYETRHHKNYKLLPFAFVFAYIVLGVPTFDSPYSLLPIIAPSAYTIAIYFGNVSQIRYTALFSSVLWLIYDIFVFSVAGIVTELIFMLNIFVAIYRYRKKNHRRKNHPSRKTHPQTKKPSHSQAKKFLSNNK